MKITFLLLILFVILNLGFTQDFETLAINTTGWIAGWHLSSADIYLKFDPHEIFAVNNSNDYAGYLNISASGGVFGSSRYWTNGGNNYIGAWYMHSNDYYVSFDWNGYRLLTINPNGWAMVLDLLKYYPYVYTRGGNSGNGAIGGWIIHSDDRYIAGNFDEDIQDKEEILAIRPSTGWAMLLKYNDVFSWTVEWSNGGNGKIAGWNINTYDKFRPGDFTNSGRDQLFIAKEPYSVLFTYNGSEWVSDWYNNGNDLIGAWNMNSNDVYLAGQFCNDQQESLMPINPNGWSMKLIFNGSNWVTDWSNDGNYYIGGWHIHSSDKYVINEWASDPGDELLAVYNGQAYILGCVPPEPLDVYVSGPSYLNPYQIGSFTANPSGGSGSYVNYRWWKRWDNISPAPASITDKSKTNYRLESKPGTNIPNLPPPGTWTYLSYYQGYQTIQQSGSESFSLKCEVTDSDNNTAIDIHSVTVSGNNVKLNQLPTALTLSDNYPNPFNPTTIIRFGLPEAQDVSIKIYSITGEIVTTLLNDYMEEGFHQVLWNGTNDNGVKVSSGIYIYELLTKDQRLIKKMLFAK